MEYPKRLRSSEIAVELAAVHLSENSRLFAFDIILKHINTIRMEIDGVRWQPEDIEHIHRMRVASRRLRNSLLLFQACFQIQKAKKWRNSLQLSAQTLGIARDLDVQIDNLNQLVQQLPDKKYIAGIRRIILRLTQQREKTQNLVIRSVDDLLKEDTLNKIEHALVLQKSDLLSTFPYDSLEDQEIYRLQDFSSDLYILAQHGIHMRIKNVLIYEASIPEFNKDIEELHFMRKSAKWLRYTMEVFSPLYKDKLKPYIHMTRQIQEFLGDIHDSDVWNQYIPVLLENERIKTLEFYGHLRPLNPILPGINYFHHNWQKEREENYKKLLACWKTWRSENIFDRLKNSVSTPLETGSLDSENNSAGDTFPMPQPELS